MPPSQTTLPLEQVIAAAEKLPPFPDVIWKVIPLVQKMAPVREIEAVIMYDQVITAKVVALSQSPYYSRRHAVGSLRDAIVALGQQQLLQVILTACAARYYSVDPAGYDLREGELWEHAVATALLAEKLARHSGRNNALTAYTAALLHDLGKTVLHIYVEDYLDSIMTLVQEKKLRFIEAERRVLGIDHQRLGAVVARRWRLPAEAVVAIGYHHYPMQAREYRDIAALVYVANRMVSALGIGCGLDGFLQPNQDEVFAEMGITGRLVEELLADLMEALETTRQFLAA